MEEGVVAEGVMTEGVTAKGLEEAVERKGWGWSWR